MTRRRFALTLAAAPALIPAAKSSIPRRNDPPVKVPHDPADVDFDLLCSLVKLGTRDATDSDRLDVFARLRSVPHRAIRVRNLTVGLTVSEVDGSDRLFCFDHTEPASGVPCPV